MLNLEEIPGCEDMPEDVRAQEATGCEVTPEVGRGQEINVTTQVFDTGVDENNHYFVEYPTGEFPGVDVPVGDVSENSCAEYPSDEIPGVDVDSGEVAFPGVDKDFDAKPTGVEVETGAYNEVYDTFP